MGHYGKVCRQREKQSANAIVTDSDDEPLPEDIQFHSMRNGSVSTDFYEDIVVNEDRKIHFQLDTGSPISILPYEHLHKLGFTDKHLKPTRKRLSSYTRDKLDPLGTIALATRYKRRKALLSDKACVELGLVKRVHKTSVSQEPKQDVTIAELCPEVQETTGVMPLTVKLDIDPKAEPVVHAPRQQPKALLPSIKQKLREMEGEGFIKKVTEPTDWVSSMAVAQRNGKIRICLDPSNVNKAIRRSIYPMKTVEQVMSELSGKKYFSALDAKSGYCQLPLDEESSYLTTFNTPLGRFRWLRLPFGIRSAPEIYQRVIDTMLEDIEGATAIVDDIIVAGRTIEEHDEILKRVLYRATEWNVKLNLEKCRLRQTSIKYVGHIITDSGAKPDPDKIRAIVQMPEPQNKEEVSTFLGFVTYLK